MYFICSPLPRSKAGKAGRGGWVGLIKKKRQFQKGQLQGSASIFSPWPGFAKIDKKGAII